MRAAIKGSFLCVMCAASLCAAAGPRLVNEKRVFPKGDEWAKVTPKLNPWGMRLSPDGKHVLYPRAKGKAPLDAEGRPDRNQLKYELVLRNLKTGKDTVVPIEPLESGWRTVFTRFNMFDPAGKRLVLADIKVEREKIDEHATAVRASMKIVLYDIATGKTTPTEHKGRMVIAKFDRTGKGLIVMKDMGIHTASLPELKLKALNIQGMIQGVCPAADVICIWMPPRRGSRTQPPEVPQKLVLYDIRAGKQIASPPVHPRNAKLDDWETQWTADGRYLYYYDIETGGADAAGRAKTKTIARIWHRAANKLAGKLDGLVPIGPGPKGTMVLRNHGGEGIVLHDAAADKQWSLGDDTMQLIHACGRRVLYAKPSAEGRQEVYVAEITAPVGSASNPTTRPATTRPAEADSSQAQPAVPGPVLRGLGGRLAIRVEAKSWEALVKKVAPTFTWGGRDMMWIGKGQKGDPRFTMDHAYVYQPAGKAPRWVLLDYKSAPYDKWSAQIGGECIRRTAKLRASKPRSDHGSGDYAVVKDVTAKVGTVYEVGWQALMGGGTHLLVAERRLYLWHDAGGKWHFLGEGPKESTGKMGHARNYTYRTESRVMWTPPPVKPVVKFTVTCTYREWSTSDDPDFIPRRDRIQYSQCLLDGRFPATLRRTTRRPYMLPVKGETFDTLVQHLASWTSGWGTHGEKHQADILALWREALTRLNPKLPRGRIPKATRIYVLTYAESLDAMKKIRAGLARKQ